MNRPSGSLFVFLLSYAAAFVGPISPTFSRRTSFQTTVWNDLAGNVMHCLFQSDVKRDQGFDGASTGWTNWVDEKSSKALRDCLDSFSLLPTDADEQVQTCFRWLSNCPAPAIVDLSQELRTRVTARMTQYDTSFSHQDLSSDFVQRVACHLILLPSGSMLQQSLQSPAGTMIHGKLLQGGVTRFRRLNGRRTGERRQVSNEDTPSWLQYGGPERNYEAVDMGPCILMELILLPKGLESETPLGTNMVGLPISPDTFLVRASPKNATDQQRSLLNQNSDTDVHKWDKTFSKTLGGLEPQIEQIIRRVLDGRVLRPAFAGMASLDDNTDESDTLNRIRREEMQGLMDLGLQPVRGLLLYGPPGCGKTALAREISNILDAVPPKIVSAPELLDRWVGGSEKLIRELFMDAEHELKACGGDATKSALHVIVIDEIDAVFRKRSAGEGSAEVTRASAVNQILSKLDGVQALNNVLVIGMTNRKELLDPALLRPGRLEVHIEIPLPDQQGRREILKLQFDALRRSGRLSQPLCRAIDGDTKARMYMRGWQRRLLRRLPIKMFAVPSVSEIFDLSAPRWTGGWSGADIAGLVRSSGSLALKRTRNQGGTIPDDLLITLEDVRMASREMKS
ncbi:hypothetical protein FisN_29Hh050 [Fistulifera solaris]|uniref:Vesicle-fusing ATPase n=1 Tax=Fistulifera solaris TaxID=1519565 RepID=A0A1Z5K5Y4_FISSO|nr:hypothetical protein FisN_29Hh050 [Fistulifera solaris]|eukprot:GAX21615.1 hypothetical protein FisN_29Hh050 [Fistulifera solaris]